MHSTCVCVVATLQMGWLSSGEKEDEILTTSFCQVVGLTCYLGVNGWRERERERERETELCEGLAQ